MKHYFRGNQYVKSVWVKVIRITKRTIIVSALMALVGWGMYFGANYFPKTVTAQVTIPVIVESSSTPPVLQRIAQCESEKNHLDPKTGQIIYHVNSDGSIDLGYMEINSTHFAEATKLGLDLTKKSDNIAFAKWLYANQGTEPWFSSKKCWNK